MTAPYSLAALNAMPQEDFTAALGGIFEYSPWVAQRAAAKRPFAGVEQLHAAMADVVRSAAVEEQLRLIRAHPELAGKVAMRGELTEESAREQKGAGLDRCSPEEFARLQQLNSAYNEKFGFPFVIAVKGHSRQSILDNFARRLAHDREAETAECIEQIIRIGGFRLLDSVRPESGAI